MSFSATLGSLTVFRINAFMPVDRTITYQSMQAVCNNISREDSDNDI